MQHASEFVSSDRSRDPLSAFARGFLLPLKGFDILLRTPGLKRYAALPILVNAVLYGAIIAGATVLLVNYREHFSMEVSDWEFWGGFGAWLAGVVNWTLDALGWLVLIAIGLLLLAIGFFTFTLVGMIVAAPFLDMLSEKVEVAICKPDEAESLPLRLTMWAAIHGIWDALTIAVRQVFWLLLALPLLLVPGVGVIPLFLVTAFFSGLGFFDVSMARNYLRNRHKKPIIKERWWEIMGLGVAMELLFLIPFMGLFVLPVGVVAATVIYCECDWARAFRENGLEPPRGFVFPKC